jgi:hypothetical protein
MASKSGAGSGGVMITVGVEGVGVTGIIGVVGFTTGVVVGFVATFVTGFVLVAVEVALIGETGGLICVVDVALVPFNSNDPVEAVIGGVTSI